MSKRKINITEEGSNESNTERKNQNNPVSPGWLTQLVTRASSQYTKLAGLIPGHSIYKNNQRVRG